jgi:serine/threonine protein kinase
MAAPSWLNFGIARALSAGDDRLTESGLKVGTPTYMSPEQAAGDDSLDGRSDVYSLGTVLYEMLAGEPPFTRATAQAIIAKRFSGEVPRLRHARPSVPDTVEQAVTRALALVADDRFRVRPSSAGLCSRTSRGRWTRSRYGDRLAEGEKPQCGPVSRVRPTYAGQRRRHGSWVPHRTGSAVRLATEPPRHGRRWGGANVIAVLPFENLGDSAQGYFADGVSDEVRGKLSQLAGLDVIARASSNE